MESYRSKDFRKLYDRLPLTARRAVRRSYVKWRRDPFDPSLEGRRLQGKSEYYRVEILGKQYRAVALVRGHVYVWLWVGTHADYNSFIYQL